MEACDLLSLELRLDRIEAELATELPAHMRALAHRYARGEPGPRAPDVASRPTTLATARAALAHPVLADRGLALLRLAAPIAIEQDAAVAAAYAAPPSWDALAVLANARDAAAQARFGRRALDVMHALHGSAAVAGVANPSAAAPAGAAPDRGSPAGSGGAGLAAPVSPRAVPASPRAVPASPRAVPASPLAVPASPRAVRDAALDAPAPALPARLPPAISAWSVPDGVALDDHAIARAWNALRVRHGVDGVVRFERSASARPRCFVIEPGAEAVVVLPAWVATPADRFAVFHELGHVIAALALPAGIPRVVDEAAAAYVARAVEAEGPWYSAAASAARTRRFVLAGVLDRIERALPAIAERLVARPPWALWHDPSAQAAYVGAEAMADAIEQAIGTAPPPGALVTALATQRAAIDQRGVPGI